MQINATNKVCKIGCGILECKLTDSLEDYLEAIYMLERSNPKVRITDIAAKLKLSKPSVNKAINLLKNSGLVGHERYGNIVLTDEGRKIAKEIYYMHNTLKEFLINELNIDPEVAEYEACGIEHVISKDSLNKLVKYSKKNTNNNYKN